VKEELVVLEAYDGRRFTVKKEVAEQSQTLKDLISDLGVSSTEHPVPIPNVSSKTLEKVVQWCEYHYANPDPPVPETDRHRTDNISPWDQGFMNVDKELLFCIILAANYMDIRGLLDLGCKTLANIIKSKQPEDIAAEFRMPSKPAESNPE